MAIFGQIRIYLKPGMANGNALERLRPPPAQRSDSLAFTTLKAKRDETAPKGL